MKKPGKIYAAVFLPRDNVLSKENRGDKIPFCPNYDVADIRPDLGEMGLRILHESKCRRSFY